MKLTTVQWNIGGGKIRPHSANPETEQSYSVDGIDVVTSSISKYSPDIITFEETHANNSIVQAELIGQKLDYKFVNDTYDHSHLEENQELGQAILSRFPIGNHTFKMFFNPHYEIDRPDGAHWVSHDKGLTSVQVDLPGNNKLIVLTLHMVPFRVFGIDPQGEQAQPVIESAAQLIREATKNIGRFILQGDFNLDVDSIKDFFPNLFDADVQEVALAGPTTPGNKKYDHVLFRGLDLVSNRIDNEVLTDHYPIITEFKLQ